MSRTVCGICWCTYDDDGECGCNEVTSGSKPVKVNSSSTALAHTVDRLMQIPYTTMDIPSVTVARHTHLVTKQIMDRVELELFFKEMNL